MSNPIKFSDLSVATILKALKKEIKQNKQFDKSNVATLVLVSIHNALTEAYLEKQQEDNT